MCKRPQAWSPEGGDIKNHYQVVSGPDGKFYRVDTANNADAIPINYGGGQVTNARFDPQIAAQMEAAKQGERIANITDSEGAEYPVRMGDIVSTAHNVMQNGIIPVESGGSRDPLNASNPQSTANGPSQVLRGPGDDFG